MKIRRVQTYGIKFTCCKCNKVIDQGVYADLHGKAFEAYYCTDCAKLKQEASNEENRTIKKGGKGSVQVQGAQDVKI